MCLINRTTDRADATLIYSKRGVHLHLETPRTISLRFNCGRTTLNTHKLCTPSFYNMGKDQDDFVMATSQIKDAKSNDTMNDGTIDFAVGSQEKVRNFTVASLYRSVLFQMVLFGA
jgi:hypothetical protein